MRRTASFSASGYAPVFDADGSVLGAVVVEGASAAFRPLTLVRTSLYGTAFLASVLVIVIGLGYVRTVGHLGRIEENLRHTDLLASVGQVAAGVAHEIRNPLAVLRGASARLQRGDALPAAERADLLRMIDEEVSRMGIVVQNFLDLSRRPKGEPEPFALKPLSSSRSTFSAWSWSARRSNSCSNGTRPRRSWWTEIRTRFTTCS